jgi:hypothetical protein
MFALGGFEGQHTKQSQSSGSSVRVRACSALQRAGPRRAAVGAVKNQEAPPRDGRGTGLGTLMPAPRAGAFHHACTCTCAATQPTNRHAQADGARGVGQHGAGRSRRVSPLLARLSAATPPTTLANGAAGLLFQEGRRRQACSEGLLAGALAGWHAAAVDAGSAAGRGSRKPGLESSPPKTRRRGPGGDQSLSAWCIAAAAAAG